MTQQARPTSRHELDQAVHTRDVFKIMCVGTLVSSMVYQLFVFAAAAMYGMRFAMALAIIAAGVTYLSFLAQIDPSRPRGLTVALVALSILFGALSGALVVIQLIVG